MKIFNVKVYGLDEALVRAGYPKQTKVENMQHVLDEGGYAHRTERGISLGSAPSGSGHDCYLKGIVVQADIQAPVYWWWHWDRYHFADTISSQSVMHNAKKFDLKKHLEGTDPRIVKIVEEWQQKYIRGEISITDFRRQIPWSFLFVRGITTSYLQFKTMYKQRRHHQLEEWQEFCDWLEGLEMFQELCLGGGVK